MNHGEVIYRKPAKGWSWCYIYYLSWILLGFIALLGDKFEVIGACETSPEDRVTLMVCVAINGFHPSAEYQWSCTGKIMENERTPLIRIHSQHWSLPVLRYSRETEGIKGFWSDRYALAFYSSCRVLERRVIYGSSMLDSVILPVILNCFPNIMQWFLVNCLLLL